MIFTAYFQEVTRASVDISAKKKSLTTIARVLCPKKEPEEFHWHVGGPHDWVIATNTRCDSIIDQIVTNIAPFLQLKFT